MFLKYSCSDGLISTIVAASPPWAMSNVVEGMGSSIQP